MGTVFLSVAINSFLIGVLYLLLKSKIRRLIDGEEALDTIRDEVNRLIVELNQTADRNIGIIEERIERLKKLVDEADRKITLLGKESEKVRLGADVYDRLKKSKSLMAESTKSNAETETTPKIDSPAAGRPAGKEAARSSESTSAVSRVLELYRQGFEPRIIAANTGSTLGEIELIISLAGNR